jgi:LacI family transcriptional regulator
MGRKPERSAVTVYDVADAAGVSIATVSRAIRSPEAVSEGARDRVDRAIRELGYVPSAPARALADRRTGALGLLLPGFDDIQDEVEASPAHGPVRVLDDRTGRHSVDASPFYFDEVLRGAEVETWRRGLALVVAAGGRQGPEVAGRVDGLAVFARTMPDDRLAHIARRIPVVLLADERAASDIDSVSVDNAHGMRTIVDHIIGTLGIGDLAYLAGPHDSPDDLERREGLHRALDEHGIPRERVRVRHGDFGLQRARALTADLLAERVPRALVCSNDQSALGALEAIRAAGLRVPEDVVVTGFDGIEASGYASPPITTVRQPMAALGRAAIRALADRIADPSAPPQHVTLSVEVLLRASCPPEL